MPDIISDKTGQLRAAANFLVFRFVHSLQTVLWRDVGSEDGADPFPGKLSRFEAGR